MSINNIRILTTVKELENIKSEWNILWKSNPNRTPYQRWEWNYCWVKSASQERTLYVLTGYDVSGELIGIAPLRQTFRIGPAKVLSFISQEASNYLDFIIKEDSSSEIVTDLVNYLVADRRISGLDLKIAEPSISLSPVTAALDRAGWYGVEAKPYTKRLTVSLGDDYETYLSGLSTKMRQEIRAEVKKLDKLHRVEFICSDNGRDFEQEMDVLCHLNSLRWGGDPKTSHPNHRECYRAFLASDGVRIFGLLCDGKAVGALSALTQDDTLFAELAGFDYSIAKVDLGKVFYHYLFSWAVAAGYSKIDFSSGEEPYKFRYNPEVLNKWQIRAFRDRKSYRVVKTRDRVTSLLWGLKQKVAESKLYRSCGVANLYRFLKGGKGFSDGK